MKYMAGIFLMALALWQLIVAFKIRRIAKSGMSKEFANNQIERLNKISRVVQFFALASFLAFLYWGIK